MTLAPFSPFVRLSTTCLLLVAGALHAQQAPATVAGPDFPDAVESPAFENGDSEVSLPDPWERFNRPIFQFNNLLDRTLLRPAAKIYVRVTPRLFRRGVGNFFDNLLQPVTTVNLLLQGQPKQAAGSLGRFLLNTTMGLGGVFDPASHAGIPAYDEDFGQTFHRWGWKRSRYVVLPLFGPATVRDGVGKGVTTRISPISWLVDREGPEYSVLYGLNSRARGLSADNFLRGGEDEYLLLRSAYLQYRRCQLIDCSDELPDYLLPDYEFELPDVEALKLRR